MDATEVTLCKWVSEHIDNLPPSVLEALEKGEEQARRTVAEAVNNVLLPSEKALILLTEDGNENIIEEMLDNIFSDALNRISRHIGTLQVRKRNVLDSHGYGTLDSPMWTGAVGNANGHTLESCGFSMPTYSLLSQAGIRWLAELPEDHSSESLMAIPGFTIDNLMEVERVLYGLGSTLGMKRIMGKVDGTVVITNLCRECGKRHEQVLYMLISFFPDLCRPSSLRLYDRITSHYRSEAMGWHSLLSVADFSMYYEKICRLADLEGHKIRYDLKRVDSRT